ncbi:MAG: tyrosine-protein phosphatase [Treponema sp.]|jgi:protein-tyrosine phosphatase|nr:tyrosine-protein phosphatase [Treponema sp.]
MKNFSAECRGQKQRLLPAEGVHNLRELGGYPVTGEAGRKGQVTWGLLYRAGELSAMTAGDKRLLEERNIRTVVDFRSNGERNAAPDGEIATVVKRVPLPIDAGNLMDMVFTFDGAEQEMKKLYAALPEEAVPRYRVLFELLSDPSNTPLLYHCTAGKDRTGLASALILYALGADMETIYGDYLASTALLRERLAPMMESQPHIVPYMTVQKSYLETAFAEIEKYGGYKAYIQNELRVDMGHLRDLYTECGVHAAARIRDGWTSL